VDYTFLTWCPKCGEEFSVFWVMDPSRVGLESVARISCAVCGQRFWQRKADLDPLNARGQHYLTGRPVRSVELIYDCPSCGKPGIFVSLIHTDLPWEELSKENENVQAAFCDNALCPRSGVRQRLRPARILGALNASWA
jgi:transcription elongation factor Elf1